MYFVVRKDLRLDVPAAVALAGGATIACARRIGESHAEAFRAWHGTAVRKVAVRASAEELEAVLAVHEGFLDERGLACLPPIAEDVTFAMPPHPHWWRGRDDVIGFDARTGLPDLRKLRTEANGQPAVAWYVRETPGGPYVARSIEVLSSDGERVSG